MQPSSAAAVELPIGARNASHTIPRNQNGEDEYPPFRTAAPRRCEEAAALAMPLGLNLTTIGCRSTAFAVVMLSTRQTGSACARAARVRGVAADASASEVRGAGEKHGMPARPGAALAEERLLGVVGAKLRAKMLPGGCAPEFDVAVTRPEGLAAEHAAAWAAVREIPAAGQHRNLSTICAVLRARS